MGLPALERDVFGAAKSVEGCAFFAPIAASGNEGVLEIPARMSACLEVSFGKTPLRARSRVTSIGTWHLVKMFAGFEGPGMCEKLMMSMLWRSCSKLVRNLIALVRAKKDALVPRTSRRSTVLLSARKMGIRQVGEMLSPSKSVHGKMLRTPLWAAMHSAAPTLSEAMGCLPAEKRSGIYDPRSEVITEISPLRLLGACQSESVYVVVRKSSSVSLT